MKSDLKKLIPSGGFSLGYFLVSLPVRLIYFVFFSKIIILDAHKKPKGGRTILAPNHQNALIDALALACTSFSQTIFLGRSDIFKNPFIARILKFLKISPVFRMRDGYDTLDNNTEVFDAASQILLQGGYIGIFPEGNHGGFRRLRPLVKGAFRIAFQTCQLNTSNHPIWIQPVGIDYTRYSYPGGKLIICYGNPIRVNDYLPLYKQSPAEAINKLRKDFSDELKNQIIHISNESHYDFLLKIRLWLWDTPLKTLLGNNSKNAFRQTQNIVTSLDFQANEAQGEFLELETQSDAYQKIIEKAGIQPFSGLKPHTPALALFRYFFWSLITFPVTSAEYVLHFLPKMLVFRLSKIPKDPQFISSFMVVGALLAFPIYYLIILLTIWILGIPLAAACGVVCIMPFLFILKRGILAQWKKSVSAFRLYKLSQHSKESYNQIMEFESRLQMFLKKII